MNKITLFVAIFSVFSFISGFYVSDWKKIEDIFTTRQLITVESESFYTCPMHSHVHMSDVGNCPICNMKLVEEMVSKKELGNINQKESVYVDPSVIHNFGIKVNEVKKGTMYRELLTYGYVNKIESVVAKDITSPVAGKIVYITEKKNESEASEHELVVTIESSDWKKLQQSYLNALDNKNVRELRRITQQLSSAGFKIKEIQNLKNSLTPTSLYNIYSNERAILKKLNLKIGQQVEKNSILFSLAPVYPIIGYAEIFEGQWRWLVTGQQAQMIIRSVPGVSWQGEVLEVDDILMNRSRTIKTKLGFKIKGDILLKAGMQANFTIFASPKHEVLFVPQDAVIRTANQSRVIQSVGNGHFKTTVVKTGLEDGRRIEIVAGLNEGMTVVTSGQFLLDSESQLNAELQRLSQPTLAQQVSKFD